MILLLLFAICAAEDLPTQANLDFYLTSPTKPHYEKVTLTSFIFSVNLPILQSKKIEEIAPQLYNIKPSNFDTVIKKLGTVPLNDTYKVNLEVLQGLTLKIFDKFILVEKLFQYILEFSQVSDYVTDRCYLEYSFDTLLPTELSLNVQNLIENLNFDLDPKILGNPNSSEHKIIKKYLESVLNLSSKIYINLSVFFNIINDLNQKILSNDIERYILNNYKCNDLNNDVIFEIKYCIKNSKTFNCILEAKNPLQLLKVESVYPVSIFDYNLPWASYFIMNDKLINLNCNYISKYFNADCTFSEIEKDCYNSVKNSKMEDIIDNCNFIPTSNLEPILLSNSVLILREPKVINFIKNNTLIKTNIDLKTLPLQIFTDLDVEIVENSKSYSYYPTSTNSYINYFKYEKSDKDILLNHLSYLWELPYISDDIIQYSIICLFTLILIFYYLFNFLRPLCKKRKNPNKRLDKFLSQK